MKFLIYGAYGYTGQLIVEKASKESLDFDIAGRDQQKTEEMAATIDRKGLVFSLDKHDSIVEILKGYDCVIHCAGPFSKTAKPMIEACLEAKTHYIDITGEIEVFEMLKSLEDKAKQANIFILPGAGFDVVPTDCLAAALKKELPDATKLDLGFMSDSTFSRGTALTMAESLHQGGAIRENGKIRKVPNAYKSRTVERDGKTLSFVSIPWGDVSTAYHSTGIPNVTTFFGVHPKAIDKMRSMDSLKWIFGLKPVQYFIRKRIKKKITGPTEEQRANTRTWVWGEAVNDDGKSVFAEIETIEGYELTAHSVVNVMKKVTGKPLPSGFLTPSLAFGYDFILEIPDTELKFPE